MTVARHCEGPGCETWQRMASNLKQHGWLDVTEVETEVVHHFCGWDCAMKYAAQFEPPTVIEGAP